MFSMGSFPGWTCEINAADLEKHSARHVRLARNTTKLEFRHFLEFYAGVKTSFSTKIGDFVEISCR